MNNTGTSLSGCPCRFGKPSSKCSFGVFRGPRTGSQQILRGGYPPKLPTATWRHKLQKGPSKFGTKCRGLLVCGTDVPLSLLLSLPLSLFLSSLFCPWPALAKCIGATAPSLWFRGPAISESTRGASGRNQINLCSCWQSTQLAWLPWSTAGPTLLVPCETNGQWNL